MSNMPPVNKVRRALSYVSLMSLDTDSSFFCAFFVCFFLHLDMLVQVFARFFLKVRAQGVVSFGAHCSKPVRHEPLCVICYAASSLTEVADRPTVE